MKNFSLLRATAGDCYRVAFKRAVNVKKKSQMKKENIVKI